MRVDRRPKQPNSGIATHGSYRAQLRCRLAMQRAELLWQLVGLDEETLTRRPVSDGRTAKDYLARVAAQDELYARRIERVLDGEDEIGGIDVTDSAAGVDVEHRDLPLEEALQACLAARARFLSALARVDDEQLHRSLWPVDGAQSIDGWARERYQEDGLLARQLAQGRKDRGLNRSSGPRSLLLAALKAGRKEILLTSALIPAEDREIQPVCGAWTLKDVLGHVTDRELMCVDGLKRIAAGRLPRVEYAGDQEGWNRTHTEARRGQSWDAMWHELHATRQELLKVVQQLRDDQLTAACKGIEPGARERRASADRPYRLNSNDSYSSRAVSSPWSEQDTAYTWVRVCLAHDREHARNVRAAIGFD